MPLSGVDHNKADARSVSRAGGESLLMAELGRGLVPLGQSLERPFPRGWWPSRRGALGRLGGDGRPGLRSVQVSLGHSTYWTDEGVGACIRADPEADPAAGAGVGTVPSGGRRLGVRVVGARPLGVRPVPGARA